MSDAHDIRQFAVYVRNLMQGTSRLSKLALAMSCWLQSEGEEIGILVKDEWSDDSAPIGRRRKRGRPRVNQVTSQEWQNLLLSVDLLPRGKPRPDQMVRNLRQIAIPLGLDDLEQDILKLSVAYGIDKRIEGLIDALFPSVYPI